MIPFGTHTVTLLYKTDDGYSKALLSGCSWKDKTEHTLSEGALVRAQTTVCRIPASEIKPSPGDLLILGVSNAEANNAVELARLRESLQREGTPAFRVQTVLDNSRAGILPHYAAEGA